MTEILIESIIRLVAIVTNSRDEKERKQSTKLIERFMKAHVSSELRKKYLNLFETYLDDYYQVFRGKLFGETEQERRYNMNVISNVCERMVSGHDVSERISMVIYLLDFIKLKGALSQEMHDFVQLVAKYLKLDQDEFSDIENFILYDSSKIKNKKRVCVISGQEQAAQPEFKHIYNENQEIRVIIYRIASVNIFIVRYTGPRNMYISGHLCRQHRTYFLPPGSVLKTSRVQPVYFNRVLSAYNAVKDKDKVIYCAEEISHKFSKRKFGVHPLNITEESGHLVGIMGGSGSGKSTLLNLLIGNIKLSSGRITINGIDINDPNNKERLKGVIGYVPQDDMLIEELTVYDNLWFNAKMCFANASKEDLVDIVDRSLVDFDLLEAKDLMVGNPLKKIISGGQRKRLNIALEMMREPSILFVDEPTSGLSSMDSEKVMNLLKRQTFHGKLVFAVLHQPSSDIYKMLDRLMIMDQGGYLVYNGNAIESVSYFKKRANYINANETECTSCGNLKAEQPLRIIEARMVAPDGRQIRKRKRTPKEWNKTYKKYYLTQEIKALNQAKAIHLDLPKQKLEIPSRKTQFKYFYQRDFKVKVSNLQYLIITLLQAPLLALVLGFFTRYNAGTANDPSAYVFSENVNIPSYFFMSIIVALFLGLIQSAQEIFKDKITLKRESFLNLSRSSFLASKVFTLFLMSAFQMFFYVFIGNKILGIEGMTIQFWMILFAVSCFSNMLGLNLSAGLNSAVTIYVVIPLLLIPQILFSGTVVDFKKLPQWAASPIYSPMMGDVMPSRWAYEAMAVYHYKENKYHHNLFDVELERQRFLFINKFQIPKLKLGLEQLDESTMHEMMYREYIAMSRNFPNEFSGAKRSSKAEFSFDDGLEFIDHLNRFSQVRMQQASSQKDSIIESLKLQHGGIDGVIAFKQAHNNDRLSEYLTHPFESNKSVIYNYRIYRNDKPIYTLPQNRYGRSHFLSPYKRLGDLYIPTLWFNVIVIWIYTLLMWALLYFDVLERVIKYSDRKMKQFQTRND